MLARDIVFIIILFGLVTALGFVVVADVASDNEGYNVTNMVDENLESHYDTLTNISQDVEEMQNETSSEGGMSVISVYTTMFSATFTIIGIVFRSVGIVNNSLVSFASDFGIPAVVVNVLMGALLIIVSTIIIFVIASSVSRGRL